ncbi:aminotransferase class I/II-fold pyridoxal phosphate-dependent enzyme [Allofrancisella guangzhouensis]|nr:aminotransferase class I/II-fold pyridoxal phosphate-dependent enzyme [Allofrancisella guangzhouensis]
MKKNWIKLRVNKSKSYLGNIYKISNSVYNSIFEKNVFLTSDQKCKEFMSCSYLGLHNDKRIIKAIQNSKELIDQNLLFSSARTRMTSAIEERTNNKLQQIFNPYHIVQFQNVHTIHLGVLPLLLSGEFPMVKPRTNGFYCIIDKFSHQSIKVMIGIISQFCDVNIVDLEDWDTVLKISHKITDEDKTLFIITDSLGSMGKVYDVKKLVNLIEENEGYIYFDDAHGMSILGKHGCGYVLATLENKLNPRVFISTGLTKAFGSHGGVILTPYKEQIDFIKTYATTYTFSGPISNPNLIATDVCCDIHLSSEIYALQKKLYDNISFFDKNFKHTDKNICFHSILPFRPILLGSEKEVQDCLSFLKSKGILVTGAVYPTVEKNKSIIRIALSAIHIEQDILSLVESLHSFLEQYE